MKNLSKENIKTGFLITCWALYDLANQFFALNIVSLYFPRWLTLEKKAPEIIYSIAFGISIFFVALLAPILGVISDIKGLHKRFLVYFTVLSIAFTLALGLTPNILWCLIFFAIANFGCQEAVVFYNSLMVKIAPKNRIGLVSGLGKMFGYIGAVLALYLAKPVILRVGYQPVFILTGLAFLIFSLPIILFVKEEPIETDVSIKSLLTKANLRQIFRRLKTTLFDSYKHPGLYNFFKAMFLCLCAVNTIILFMSVYATKAFGLTEAQIIDLIMFSTIFAIAGSIFSGFISDIIGHIKAMNAVFMLWIVSFLAATLLKAPFHWVIGALVGTSLGSTWVISRALAIKLVPEEQIGEIFGLFNVVGYISGIIGPLLWGLILLYLSSWGERGYRLACLLLIAFVASGFIFLLKLNKENQNKL
jgi:UMF1 family MFS transporter